MKEQRYAVVALFALILASSLTSLGCYSATSRRVEADMNRALALTMQEQQSDVISQDTIRSFNRHLQIAELRGHATLVVDTRVPQFRAYARCSEATIFRLSEQRPALVLWLITLLWAMFVWRRFAHSPLAASPEVEAVRHSAAAPQCSFGGLCYAEDEGRFYSAGGEAIALTPMQSQLMEMFFKSPTHTLTKSEICAALWPKKPDATATLYTLIRRLKPVVEQYSALRIESDRSRAYRLTLS